LKIALVTGAAKRIGKVIAERLLLDGYSLIVHANTSVTELMGWVSHNPRKNQILGTISADLSTDAGQELLVSQIKKLTDVIELVVHNASMFYPKPFSEVSRHNLQEMLAVNLTAPYFITQGLLPLLEKADHPSVINIIDSMWERPSPQFSHYAIGKAGLAILTRSLANELAPKIRVNAVAPGAILFQSFHGSDVRKRTIEKIPQKKIGNPIDIADAVIFLHQAKYATGEILAIDGGRSIVP
jgi:pteridine reductase